MKKLKKYIALVSMLLCVSVAQAQENQTDTCAVNVSDSTEVEEWTRWLHLKTNAVGLGMAMVNAAVEIDVTKHWSIVLPVYYSAWNYFKETIKFRTLAIMPESRYWISENNDGFFAGAHFGLAYYNFAFNGPYRYQDHFRQNPALGGGLSIGYRLPVSKNDRLHLEFSIGGGAYKLHYDIFYNTRHTQEGLLIESVNSTYWGIDQVAVSFSYAIDLKKKGERR